jgi:hypothetical protein
VKGQLRVRGPAPFINTVVVVERDVDGDGAADFQIELSDFTALSTLTAIDFKP